MDFNRVRRCATTKCEGISLSWQMARIFSWNKPLLIMTTVTKRKYRHKLRFIHPCRFRIYATIIMICLPRCCFYKQIPFLSRNSSRSLPLFLHVFAAIALADSCPPIVQINNIPTNSWIARDADTNATLRLLAFANINSNVLTRILSLSRIDSALWRLCRRLVHKISVFRCCLCYDLSFGEFQFCATLTIMCEDKHSFDDLFVFLFWWVSVSLRDLATIPAMFFFFVASAHLPSTVCACVYNKCFFFSATQHLFGHPYVIHTFINTHILGCIIIQCLWHGVTPS